MYLKKCGIAGLSYTYSELRDRSAAFAVSLQNKFNLNKDDVLALCLPNCPQFAIVGLGTIEAGLIVTPVNPFYTAGKKKKIYIIYI